uniref:Uncharacterized protein n=1 Tax=Magallana gigas TaxID=29159 RepID=A0A8W8MJ70_MAGGI
MKIADTFVSLYENDWTDIISSQALSSLHEKKYNKPMLIPLVEDVKKLNIYLDTEAKRVCLRRSGEAERMTLSAFSEAIKTGSGKPDNVVLSTLNAFEKTLCHSHLRVEIKAIVVNQEDLTGERTVPFSGNCRPLVQTPPSSLIRRRF